MDHVIGFGGGGGGVCEDLSRALRAQRDKGGSRATKGRKHGRERKETGRGACQKGSSGGPIKKKGSGLGRGTGVGARMKEEEEAKVGNVTDRGEKKGGSS